MLSIALTKKWELHRIKKFLWTRWNSIQLKTYLTFLTYMECKCYKKATIWIVFIHYLTPRELTKDFKGKKRKNESRTKMESVYLLLFVSTNFVTSIFLLVEKYFNFLPTSSAYTEVQNFSVRWRLRFVLHWNKTFGKSWRRFSASLAVKIFSMWVSKVAKNSVRRQCSFEIMPDANEMQPTEKSRLKVCFLYRKLHGSLEASISLASILNFRWK